MTEDDLITLGISQAMSAGPELAVANADANPDQGARAQRIAQATGLPALAVVNDPDFELNHRRQVSADIVSRNAELNMYLQSDPMASIISNDDYGTLDRFSESSKESLLWQTAVGRYASTMIKATERGWEGIKEGWGPGSLSEKIGYEPIDRLMEDRFNVAGQIYRGVYFAGQLGLKALGAFAKGATGAAAGFAEGAYEAAGLEEVSGARGAASFGRDIGAMVEMALNQPPLAMGISPKGVAGFRANRKAGQLAEAIEAAPGTAGRIEPKPFALSPEMEAGIRIKPWVDAGIEPPSGLHPIVDMIKADANAKGLIAMENDLAIAFESMTRERDPGMFKKFVDQHFGDSQISISAEKVMELYRDRIPEPGDGILGWVPGIAEKLEAAKAIGEDVHVSRADFLARIDPTLYPALREDIRMWPGGVTLREAQVPVEPRVVVDSPLAQVRDAAGLEPVFMLGDRKVALHKLEEMAYKPGEGFHEYALKDGQGKDIGNIVISPMPHQKTLYVDWVGGLFSNSIGPSAVRDLKRQLKELYPDYEYITGHRVSGAREQSGVWEDKAKSSPKVALMDEGPKGWGGVGPSDQFLGFQRIMNAAWERRVTPTLSINIKPTEFYTAHEQALANTIHAEVSRIIGRGAEVVIVQNITSTRAIGKIGGFYLPYKSRKPIIAINLFAPEQVGAARHESIHYLRKQGFFKPEEWSILEKEADKWIKEHNIEKRYPFLNRAGQMEEAIAEAFRTWDGGKALDVPAEAKGVIERAFERIKDLWESIKARFKAETGEELTWEKLFEKVDSGEIGQRVDAEPLNKEAFKTSFSKQAELQEWAQKNNINLTKDDIASAIKTRIGQIERDQRLIAKENREGNPASIELRMLREELRSLEDEPSFSKDVDPAIKERMDTLQANAVGLDIKSYRKLQEKIQERYKEDIEAAQKRAEAIEKKTLTAEWRTNLEQVRAEVEATIRQRPDVAADLFLGSGELAGQKLRQRYTLAIGDLTPEQQAWLPKHYMSKEGLPADDVAQMLGFPDKASLVEGLVAYAKEKDGRGPQEALRHIINQEAAKVMRERYGNLDDNVMLAAKDRAFSETELNLIAEEMQGAAQAAGKAVIDRDLAQAEMARIFENMKVSDVRSDKLMALVGKHGRDAERALIAGKDADALISLQKKYMASLITKMAINHEKAAEALEKIARPYQRREIKGPSQEFVPYIQGLLSQAGFRMRLSPQEIARGVEFHGHGTLAEFTDFVRNQGFDPVVAPEIAAAGVKPIKEMTIAEWNDFNDAIKSLNHIGRAVERIEIAGSKQDFAEFKAKVRENLEQLPVRSEKSQGNWFYRFDASLTRTEEIVKDLDLRQELGPLWDAVIRPMELSKAKEFELMTDLADHFNKTRGDFGKAWRKSLGDTIDQKLIWDPYNKTYYDMTRENMIQIMLNWGSRSNIDKYVKGAFFAKEGRRPNPAETASLESQIKAMIDKHATEQDWQFVQRMWEPFKKWQPMMDTVARNTTGVAPKWIEAAKVQTKFGELEGGYWPVNYDRLRSNLAVIEDRAVDPKGVFDTMYYRAATSKSHLKERTGYVDFVNINSSIEQAAGKMQQTIHDIAFRDAMIQASKVFYDRDIRGLITKHYGEEYADQLVPWLKRVSYQYSVDDKALSAVNGFLRRMRINLVGHSLPLNLKVILSPDVGALNPAAWARFVANRSENMKFAMENSQEIKHLVYNMDRDYTEALNKIVLDTEFGDLRKKSIEWGFKPVTAVSQQFRAATFVDEFAKAKAKGMSDVEASLIADSYVRERHGTASVVDLPAMMASNEGLKMLTVFQGYFNTMYNWQRQLPGNVRRREIGKFMETALGSIGVGAAFGALLFNQQKESDSWFKTIGKAMLVQPLSTIPGLNQVTNFFFEGFAPRMPFASLFTAAGQVINDAKKVKEGKRPEKPITHGANVIGLSTGLPLAQVGRTSQFIYDVNKGYQRPRNIIEYSRGIISGEARLKP